MRRGRPLRFLAVTLGGWIAMRAALLWPEGEAARSRPDVVPVRPAARSDVLPPPSDPAEPAPPSPPPARRPPAVAVRRRLPSEVQPAEPRRNPTLALAAPIPASPPAASPDAEPQTAGLPTPLRPVAIARAPGRVAGSAWLIARGGANRDPLAGQLGGSQAGARLTYTLDHGRRVAASARIAGPLGGGGTEGAVGIDWQPTRAPLHLLAEQRIPLDGGRGGPALLALGGIGPVALARGVRIEAYAQGGIVKRDRAEGFGDGAARLTAGFAMAGPVRLDLGAGAWGGIQRGARRLDLGPTLGAALPVAGKALRLTLDWRQRVAGNARPGSGPALSVGTDF